jgi:hypothetical protein
VIAVEEMDRLDDELRELIRKMWPVQARKKKLVNLLVPPNGGMYVNVFVMKSYNTCILLKDELETVNIQFIIVIESAG